MNLIIQIPSYNEARSLPETLGDLPRSIPGVSRIVILVIDDGSTDDTAQIALRCGANYVVRHRSNRGLAQAFMTGLNASIALGADVIVNTDADHQYPGRYIAELVAPILAGKADVVVGDRRPGNNIHFSPLKRLLEKLGSWVIRVLSQTNALDAASGFRAYSRYAALRMHVYNQYSYTLETLIQAGRERMAISHVPIETNAARRQSRLHRGALDFILRQSGTIIRTYVIYKPLQTFVLLGTPFLLSGALLIGRFVYFYLAHETGVGRYVQSITIGGTLALFGLLSICIGLLGDATRANRQMMIEILAHLRGQNTLSSEGPIEIYPAPEKTENSEVREDQAGTRK